MNEKAYIDWDRVDDPNANPRFVGTELFYRCECGTEYLCDTVSESYVVLDDCETCRTAEERLIESLTLSEPAVLTYRPFETLGGVR